MSNNPVHLFHPFSILSSGYCNFLFLIYILLLRNQILQLQSDYKKEFETLREKHCMMLQNVNTAVALKNKELETQRGIVLMNMILADIWVRNNSSW